MQRRPSKTVDGWVKRNGFRRSGSSVEGSEAERDRESAAKAQPAEKASQPRIQASVPC